MQVQNINNTNFQSGYKFICTSKEERAAIKKLIPRKGKAIYEKFEDKPRNVFLIANDSYHNIIADFIDRNNINYRYYPDIKLGKGFTINKPEKVSDYIKNIKSETIDFENLELKQAMKAIRLEETVKKESPVYTKNILQSLHVNPSGVDVQIQKGVTIVTTPSKSERICISPPVIGNIHYVKSEPVLSTSEQEPVKRYIITSDGKCVKKYSPYTPWEDLIKFDKLFHETIIK